VDLFVPDPEPALFFDDGPGPAAMLQISSRARADLERLAHAPEFSSLLAEEPARAAPEAELSFGLFEVLPTPVGGQERAAPRTAPMSFVVRYYGPMADEAAFTRFYVQNHPQVLARFPEIRNVFCYLPVPWDNPGLPASRVRLGNEVVFDDVAALNAAMSSPVMELARADSAQFPPFGHSTHHPMRRRSLTAPR
jgi:hypothetical protein